MQLQSHKQPQNVGLLGAADVRRWGMRRKGAIDPSSPEAIARRLRALRGALNKNQKEMTLLSGSRNRGQKWANYESLNPLLWRRIGLDSALRLCYARDITLEWIYRGDARGMPPDLMAKIRAWQDENPD